MLRELHGSVRVLADAEKLRRDTEAAQIRRKYVGRLGALGAWAAGGGDAGRNARRSPEHAAAEETAAALAAHREGVLWLLRTRLGEAADTQRAMMDIRLSREMERNRSVLAARSRGPAGSPGMPGLGPLSPSPTTAVTKENGARVGGGVSGLPPDEGPGEEATQQFSPEQVQMFERDNQDMLRHYESTLDQVRYAWTPRGKRVPSLTDYNADVGLSWRQERPRGL